MKQFEAAFDKQLQALENDARAAAVFVYTEITLHYFFGSDCELLDRVNPLAGFWNGALAALQTSGFIALGRLYDRDKSAHTIHSILEYIKNNPRIFDPNALKARRIAAGMSTGDAATFTGTAQALREDQIKAVRIEFEHYRNLYTKNVEPIRHKVFAHAGRISRQDRDALFTRVFVRDVERMVVFPLRLHRALFGLYMNGLALDLDSPPTNIGQVLNNLPGPSTSTWEHLHVVRDAVELIAWIRTAPVPESRMEQHVMARLVRALELKKYGLTEDDYASGMKPRENSDGNRS